jgi:hypothetical protein
MSVMTYGCKRCLSGGAAAAQPLGWWSVACGVVPIAFCRRDLEMVECKLDPRCTYRTRSSSCCAVHSVDKAKRHSVNVILTGCRALRMLSVKSSITSLLIADEKATIKTATISTG